MITLRIRQIELQINGIVMAVVGTEDTAYWKKVYNFFLKKVWILYLLWRISVRKDVR